MSDKQIMGQIKCNSFLNQCTFLTVSYDKYLLWYSVCDTNYYHHYHFLFFDTFTSVVKNTQQSNLSKSEDKMLEQTYVEGEVSKVQAESK